VRSNERLKTRNKIIKRIKKALSFGEGFRVRSMNINKNNYEAFFLDYHEGNLSPQQVADLLLFVEQRPELKEEFESFENVTLDDLSAIPFEDKSSLKKEITTENKEEYFIKSIENTLSPTEKNLLDIFIKQHPQLLVDLQLFQKTKVAADMSVVFENKEALKRNLSPALSTSSVLRTPSPKEKETTPDIQNWDELLITSIEGTLTKQESVFLNQQLSVDAEMQNEFSLYKQTKLVADTTIVYEDKEELKRKERKVVPFFYYVAAAASIALLIGLFFMYNNTKNNEQNFADKTNETKTAPIENKNSNALVKNNQSIESNVVASNQTANVIKSNEVKIVRNHNSQKVPVIVNEQPVINIAENKQENNVELAPKNNSIVKVEEPKTNNEQPIAIVENKKPTTNVTLSASSRAESRDEGQKQNASEFLSLKEVVAQKLKEKTLDEESLAVQKQNGRSKKFTGWDLAQIATRGISKITGRDVEVKPTYNDDGDVTAYAFGGGLQVMRGK